MLVADNGSTDGTLDLLHDLARRAPVHVAVDTEPRYYQAAKMTRLADAARRAGAEWVVPFDADEYWFAAGTSLADHLRATREGLVRARLFNVFPTSTGGWRLDLTPHAFGKVAVRAHWAARLGIGNHTASHPGEHVPGLYIAHYPWRSSAQLRRKGVQGGGALTDDQVAGGVGKHWARFRDAEEAWTDQAWTDVLEGRAPPRPVVVAGRPVPRGGPADLGYLAWGTRDVTPSTAANQYAREDLSRTTPGGEASKHAPTGGRAAHGRRVPGVRGPAGQVPGRVHRRGRHRRAASAGARARAGDGRSSASSDSAASGSRRRVDPAT